VALLGLPPFALFAGEIGIARGLTAAHLAWALAIAFLFLLIGYTSLFRHGSRMLLGAAPLGAPRLSLSAKAAWPLACGLLACLALGVTAGPLTDVLTRAGGLLAGAP
jgi:hydrogenase-4 component F